jgi:hypothetical protein
LAFRVRMAATKAAIRFLSLKKRRACPMSVRLGP